MEWIMKMMSYNRAIKGGIETKIDVGRDPRLKGDVHFYKKKNLSIAPAMLSNSFCQNTLKTCVVYVRLHKKKQNLNAI